MCQYARRGCVTVTMAYRRLADLPQFKAPSLEGYAPEPGLRNAERRYEYIEVLREAQAANQRNS